MPENNVKCNNWTGKKCGLGKITCRECPEPYKQDIATLRDLLRECSEAIEDLRWSYSDCDFDALNERIAKALQETEGGK